MLHTEFQASEPSGSEEGDFLIFFFIYFYDLNLGPWVQDHLRPSDLRFINLDKGPLGNATYQISSI